MYITDIQYKIDEPMFFLMFWAYTLDRWRQLTARPTRRSVHENWHPQRMRKTVLLRGLPVCCFPCILINCFNRNFILFPLDFSFPNPPVFRLSLAFFDSEDGKQRRHGNQRHQETCLVAEAGLVHSWKCPEIPRGIPAVWRVRQAGDEYQPSTIWQTNEQARFEIKRNITFPLIDHPSRLRIYRLFYDKSKYFWRGPELRTILKATLPHQPLRLTADHLYFLTDDELVPTLYFCFSFSLIYFLGCKIWYFPIWYFPTKLGCKIWYFPTKEYTIVNNWQQFQQGCRMWSW